LARYGPAFAEVVDAVSAKLTSSDLTALDAAMLRDPGLAAAIARRWLANHGLL
jgi:hypothetical protein